MFSERIIEKNYVTLDVPVIIKKNPLTSKSWRRRWNQLPRLQRIVLGMLAVIGVMATLFIFGVPKLDGQELSTTENINELSFSEKEKGNSDIHIQVSEPPLLSNKMSAKEVPQDKPSSERNEVRDTGQLQQFLPPAKRNSRQEAVVAGMRHAWKGYKAFAWGHDHLLPLSRSRHDWMHLGLTLVDSIDTLWIMDMKEEYLEAREWVDKQLLFNINKDVNLFETTIRVLGGLLSAYHLSGDKMFVTKAVDLTDRLLGAFNSNSGVPYSDVNLATGKPSQPKWGPDSSTSEVATIQLEFRDLSKITGNPIYAEKVNSVSSRIHTLPKLDGLVPIFINAQTGSFRSHATITLGARGDTYYEYLLKQWIQMGRKENVLRDDYTESVNGMELHLLQKTFPSRLLFLGELHGSSKNFINKMDELSCFLPGTLALGVHYGMPPHHLKLAKELMNTCVQTWLRMPTGIAAEITFFNTEPSSKIDFFVKTNDAHYLLRPETVESLFYLYYFTGNKTYQDWGWQMFESIEKYCRVENGYTSIGNVKNPSQTKPKDKMESFFLGETLKYFYLLFSDDKEKYSLDKWVFNTEAHLLPIYKD